MKSVSRIHSRLSQRSYDFENENENELGSRILTPKEGTLSRITTEEPVSDGEASEELFMIQEISFEQPEIEGSIARALLRGKQRNSFTLPAWFFDVVIALAHFLLIATFVFFVGMIAGFFMSSPTCYAGSYLWKSKCTPKCGHVHKLYVIQDGKDRDKLHIKGALSVSHHIQNPTSFAASLSVYLSVSYLPSSKQLSPDVSKCLETARWLNNYVSPEGRGDGSDVLRKKVKEIFNLEDTSTEYENRSDVMPDVESKETGNLATVTQVEKMQNTKTEPVYVVDSHMFNVFKSHMLIAHKLHFVAEVGMHLNRINYLITINKTISKKQEDSSLWDSLLNDCKKGSLLLQLETTKQRFETMFFGGDMLPMEFYPVSVPCAVTINKPEEDKLEEEMKDQKNRYVKQYNIFLNTDAMSTARWPLTPLESPSPPPTI
ncbi:hypothetical protein BgAZ_207690 [Babesia gibsoni]|uniref:Uncharacterized protein n=1 Tax=Babesia gibsoni TaxID=33632 RepID=A0AAD8UU81_BABGI|nr:hypothetical protein BgAZ_207690 [Babesia gibsoni]